MKINKKIIAFSLALILIFSTFPVKSFAATRAYPHIVKCEVNEKEYDLRTVDDNYSGNRYVSLRSLASALKDTELKFSFSISGEKIDIVRGKAYDPKGYENSDFSEAAKGVGFYYSYNLKKNEMTIDGESCICYTMIGTDDEGSLDCYMNFANVALDLEIPMYYDGEKISIDTEKGFEVDIDALNHDGYFSLLHSALSGDATTGKIFFSKSEDEPVAIASTTKLMTYLMVMESISEGKITKNDMVPISKNVEELSSGGDAVYKLKEGMNISVDELLAAMLLSSSNEAALALAEHISGSEKEFVEMMNRRASEIGLSDATCFYNCNGLPVFSGYVLATKQQNLMSAKDMFLLVSHIFMIYPEITDITSQKEIYLDTIDAKATNTNPMLYNMDGVVGLKTGTTDRAGCCLVTAMKVMKDDTEHIIVGVEFGAENVNTRNTASEILLRIGKQELMKEESVEEEAGVPENVEDLVQRVIKFTYAR